MPQKYWIKAQPVELGNRLGRGGEGDVYAVKGRPGVALKLYHRPISPLKAQKLLAMAAVGNEQLQEMAAWPMETVQDARQGNVCGLTMPKLSDHKDIHHLYSPRSRRLEFPDANWKFLIHVAMNTCQAFRLVHAAGCVIGDVNHGGIAVSKNGTVKLIDCDSFQFKTTGTTFPCDVGVPIFTPPELQGRALRGSVRSEQHDNFGLAVLIFHLLFMGRHPFAGRYHGSGDMPIHKAIAEFRFAYGMARTKSRMEPPPHVLSLQGTGAEVASLFERAFAPEGASSGRPGPSEWHGGLGSLKDALTSCTVLPHHVFAKGLSLCPWCEIEGSTGATLFGVTLPKSSTSRQPEFLGIGIWTRIHALHPPTPRGGLPKVASHGPMQPSAEAQALRVAWLPPVPSDREFVAWIFLPPCWFALLAEVMARLFGLRNHSGIATVQGRYRNEQAALQMLVHQWSDDSAIKSFDDERQRVQGAFKEYERLPQRRNDRIADLQSRSRDSQLRSFLQARSIDRAASRKQIKGVGPSRISMLESFGIETALDVDRFRILQVPGFGPKLASSLVAWRREVEQQFRFDPSKGLDPRDVQAVDAEIGREEARLRRLLADAESSLKGILSAEAGRRSILEKELLEQQRKALASEVDWDAVRSSDNAVPPMAWSTALFFGMSLLVSSCSPDAAPRTMTHAPAPLRPSVANQAGPSEPSAGNLPSRIPASTFAKSANPPTRTELPAPGDFFRLPRAEPQPRLSRTLTAALESAQPPKRQPPSRPIAAPPIVAYRDLGSAPPLADPPPNSNEGEAGRSPVLNPAGFFGLEAAPPPPQDRAVLSAASEAEETTEWIETPTYRIKIRYRDGKETSRWEFPKQKAEQASSANPPLSLRVREYWGTRPNR